MCSSSLPLHQERQLAADSVTFLSTTSIRFTRSGVDYTFDLEDGAGSDGRGWVKVLAQTSNVQSTNYGQVSRPHRTHPPSTTEPRDRRGVRALPSPYQGLLLARCGVTGRGGMV